MVLPPTSVGSSDKHQDETDVAGVSDEEEMEKAAQVQILVVSLALGIGLGALCGASSRI
jgi:hypothetical protein